MDGGVAATQVWSLTALGLEKDRRNQRVGLIEGGRLVGR